MKIDTSALLDLYVRARYWLATSSKGVREYLKGRVIHDSRGKRSFGGRPGVTFIREGRGKRKVLQGMARRARRWIGTKPGQRGENPPFTGRRHRKAV